MRSSDKMAIVIREIMEDKIYLNLSGGLKVREATEEAEQLDGGTVDLTQTS